MSTTLFFLFGCFSLISGKDFRFALRREPIGLQMSCNLSFSTCCDDDQGEFILWDSWTLWERNGIQKQRYFATELYLNSAPMHLESIPIRSNIVPSLPFQFLSTPLYRILPMEVKSMESFVKVRNNRMDRDHSLRWKLGSFNNCLFFDNVTL